MDFIFFKSDFATQNSGRKYTDYIPHSDQQNRLKWSRIPIVVKNCISAVYEPFFIIENAHQVFNKNTLGLVVYVQRLLFSGQHPGAYILNLITLI